MTKDDAVKVEASRSGQELGENAVSPLVDVYETEKEVVLVAEVPGARREDVLLRVDKGVLTVEASTSYETPGENYARTYLGFEPGQYFRAFALSDEIDREKIGASVANGVLTVRLPKAAAARRRRIEIKTAD